MLHSNKLLPYHKEAVRCYTLHKNDVKKFLFGYLCLLSLFKKSLLATFVSEINPKFFGFLRKITTSDFDS